MLINKIDDDIERLVGTFFSGSGDVPPGISAASALAYLGERADKAMTPWIVGRARAFKRWEAMCLEIMREHATDERVYMISGRDKRWEAKKFKDTDLTGAVNMKVDYEGLFPKSQATSRATIAQLIQLQVLNPQDPEQQQKILEAFGETALRGSIDLDRREAAKEWDRFLNTDEMPEVIPLVQNSVVHLQQHADDAKSDEFYELRKTNPSKAQAWIAHIQSTAADIVMRRTTFGSFGGDPTAPTPDGSEAPTAAAELSAEQEAQNPQTPDIAAPRQPQAPPGAME